MMHLQKQVVTPTDLANYTMNNADEMPIVQYQTFLLTRRQLSITRSRANRLIFQSGYGTGKTVLLRAQVQRLAIPREGKNDSSKNPINICFIIFLEEQSLLVQTIKVFAQSFQNLEVLFLESQGIILSRYNEGWGSNDNFPLWINA